MNKFDDSPRDCDAILAAAERHCVRRGMRLTPIRRQVLALVLGYPDVVKAYDVLSDLQRLRGNAAPPTVYRALDFLVEVGILHRVESLNGFVFCDHFADEHTSVILNCTECGHTEELAAEEPIRMLLQYCHQRGFDVSAEPFVLSGRCRECRGVCEYDCHCP